MTVSAVTMNMLEKCALDAGFDLPEAPIGDWLYYRSTQTSLTLTLRAIGSTYIVGFSQQKVVNALVEEGSPFVGALPEGSRGAREVASLEQLHSIARRAFVLSRTLPDELLHQFEAVVASLQKTEVERLAVQRVGQDVFRKGLLDYWENRCAVTGLAEPRLLRASHIRAWADCVSDAQRLDVFNGLLLAAHIDAAFDAHLITFDDDGRIQFSTALTPASRTLLGIGEEFALSRITDAHRQYLAWHRARLLT